MNAIGEVEDGDDSKLVEENGREPGQTNSALSQFVTIKAEETPSRPTSAVDA